MAEQIERIRYVEPTDIGGEGCDYPSPLEDYCISVSLSVTMGDRMSCGQGELDGRTTKLFYTTEGKTISFLNAKDGYLTTKFTDVKAGENSDGSEECLGIESINISYEMSSFFLFSPQVEIRFVDVRGIAVMSEEEAKMGGKGMGSFYRALFRYPYPLFKLTVKGFYGMPVTYNLTINGGASVELDSSTGNFIISVKFRGYMEGVYNDIPMSYVVIAPYMSYIGKEYWEAQKKNGRFKYRNGGEMLTYPEFLKKVSEAAKYEESLSGGTSQKAVLKESQQREGLAALIDTFPLRGWKEDTKSGIIYTTAYGTDSVKYSEEDTATQLGEYWEKIKKYDEAYGDNLLPYFDFMKDYAIYNTPRISLLNYNGQFAPDSNEGAILLDSLSDTVKGEVSLIPRMASWAVLHIVNRGENNGMWLKEILQRRKKEVDAEYNKKKNEQEAARHQRLCDILGFPPTVRNMFNMAFAHFETFMHVFYQTLSNIKSKIDSNDDSRKFSTLGIDKSKTDTYVGESLPPFPIVTENVTRDGDEMTEVVWKGNWDIDEVLFVNSLIESAKLYQVEWAQATVKNDDSGSTESMITFRDSKDTRLSAYLTLKNIYDRWLSNIPESRWVLDVDATVDTYNEDSFHQSDFDNFCYIDTFYNDIGDRLLVNASMVGDLASLCLPLGTISTQGYAGGNQSFFLFLTEVSRICNGNLMAVPLIYGIRNISDVEKMFKAYPYIHEVKKRADTSSFVFLYTYRPSELLDTGGDFRNDGVYVDGYRKDLLPVSLSDSGGLYIPAFGITYGKQNQGIFKSIELKSSESTITDAAIGKTMNVASKASESPRETELFGQDVYSIYASKQFRCRVTMMGDAQIVPLMYFQLNNTPFWSGTYMILNVSHSVSQGNMETTFEGVRINRNTIPMAEGYSVTFKNQAWKLSK